MADPLISDAELAAMIANPVSAQDEAGSVTMRSIDDALALLKFKEKRRGLNAFAVLANNQRIAAPTGEP